MTTAVLSFCHAANTVLPERDADNWRPVPAGTYTHRSLPLGPMRAGITNGIVAYMLAGDRVQFVHLSNMDFVPDRIPREAAQTHKPTKQPRPRKSRSRYPFDVL